MICDAMVEYGAKLSGFGMGSVDEEHIQSGIHEAFYRSWNRTSILACEMLRGNFASTDLPWPGWILRKFF
jgi:hypothetical protein